MILEVLDLAILPVLPVLQVPNLYLDKNDNTYWIIHYGACDHMIFYELLLVNKIELLVPIKVGLPDGTYRLVKKTNKVILSEDLVLYNMLLMEGFKHN